MANTLKRQFIGTVASVAMTGTVTVEVDRVKIHPRYHKRYAVSKKYHCDYSGKDLVVGDRVIFEETRPLSKTKRWRIISKV